MNTLLLVEANRQSTDRLEKFIDDLSTKQLTSVLPNNWTMSVTLVHLAFWDQRVIHSIKMAKKEGKVIRTELDAQLNDIIEPFFEPSRPMKR